MIACNYQLLVIVVINTSHCTCTMRIAYKMRWYTCTCTFYTASSPGHSHVFNVSACNIENMEVAWRRGYILHVTVFSPVYFKRLNLRAFSEQYPLIFKWVEFLGFDVVANSTQNTPSHYALRKFWGEHCVTMYIVYNYIYLWISSGCDLLEVVLSTSRDSTKEHLLWCSASQSHTHTVKQLCVQKQQL